MNKIEHVWDLIGRKVNQRSLQCENIAELTDAILEQMAEIPTREATLPNS